MELTLTKTCLKTRSRRNIEAILRDENGNIIFCDFINHYKIIDKETGYICLCYGKNKQISFDNIKIIER